MSGNYERSLLTLPTRKSNKISRYHAMYRFLWHYTVWWPNTIHINKMIGIESLKYWKELFFFFFVFAFSFHSQLTNYLLNFVENLMNAWFSEWKFHIEKLVTLLELKYMNIKNLWMEKDFICLNSGKNQRESIPVFFVQQQLNWNDHRTNFH